MKRALIFFWMLASAAFCSAQTGKQPESQLRTDLTGTWEVLKSKSDKVNNPLGDAEIKAVIVQSGSEIRITRSYSANGKELSQQIVYFADGRGEKYQSPLTGNLINSKTKWEGKELVTRYSARRAYPGRVIDVDMIEIWKLSQDGNTLTLTIRTVLPPLSMLNEPGGIQVTSGPRDMKTVYNRASK